jgi:hypothetical protein
MMQYDSGFRHTASQLLHSRICLVLPAGSKTGLITPYVSPWYKIAKYIHTG